MDDNSYSIKEMIGEFRKDVADRFDNPNTGVFMRLDKIDTKQGIANGKTGSLLKSRTQIWTAIGILTVMGSAIITLAVMAINSKIKDGFSSPEVKEEIRNQIKYGLDEALKDYEK